MIVHIKELSGIQRFGTGKCCLYFVDNDQEFSATLLITVCLICHTGCSLSAHCFLEHLFFLNIKMLSKGKGKYKKKNREMSENE